jgi:hypothetical protein
MEAVAQVIETGADPTQRSILLNAQTRRFTRSGLALHAIAIPPPRPSNAARPACKHGGLFR